MKTKISGQILVTPKQREILKFLGRLQTITVTHVSAKEVEERRREREREKDLEGG